MKVKDIASKIDHALLNPALSQKQLDDGILIGIENQVASICILPYYLKECSLALKRANSKVKSSTVIGFPHGTNTTETKINETIQALCDGCEEVDLVCNISKVISKDYDYVKKEIEYITNLVHRHNQFIKIIFENYYLEDEHKIKLCQISTDCGADFVKTSTGFAKTGALEHDLLLMREHSGDNVKIKASGGIKSLDTILKFLDIGVSRVGLSSTLDILKEAKEKL